MFCQNSSEHASNRFPPFSTRTDQQDTGVGARGKPTYIRKVKIERDEEETVITHVLPNRRIFGTGQSLFCYPMHRVTDTA
jgi:hypothetical protein